MRIHKEGIIYCAVWVQTGEPFYVGQTRQELRERVRQHFKSIKTPMAKILRELGREAVEFRELEKVAGLELDDRERYWIEKLNTRHPLGLNQSVGGHTGGLHLDTSKAKMSRVMKAKCAEPGYRAKIAERNSKLWSDPEYRKRQAEGAARSRSDPAYSAYLDRMAAFKTDYWRDPEKRAQMRARTKELWADPQHRAMRVQRLREAVARKKASEQFVFA